MPGDTLTKEELLLVEKMIGERIANIDYTMERAYEMSPSDMSETSRRIWARNKVVAELLKMEEDPSGERFPGFKVQRRRRQPLVARPVVEAVSKPKESPFDVKPRQFTLEDE
jgi:hypothetical protein